MKAYSEDLRLRAIKLIDGGKDIEKVAILLNIGRSSLYLWLKQRREKGTLAPKKNWQKGHGHKIKDLEKFKKFIESHPGLTAVEIAKKKGNMSVKTTCKWLHRIGFTRKKRPMDIKNAARKNATHIWSR